MSALHASLLQTVSGGCNCPHAGHWIARVKFRQAVRQDLRPLADTEDAQSAFWSPDNENVAFVADGIMKRVSVASGPAQTICEVDGSFRGGSWNREGVILFGTSPGTVYRVPASGGVPQALPHPIRSDTTCFTDGLLFHQMAGISFIWLHKPRHSTRAAPSSWARWRGRRRGCSFAPVRPWPMLTVTCCTFLTKR